MHSGEQGQNRYKIAPTLKNQVHIELTNFTKRFVVIDELTGEPLAEQPYRIVLENGKTYHGRTSETGETMLAQAKRNQKAYLQLITERQLQEEDGEGNPFS